MLIPPPQMKLLYSPLDAAGNKPIRYFLRVRLSVTIPFTSYIALNNCTYFNLQQSCTESETRRQLVVVQQNCPSCYLRAGMLHDWLAHWVLPSVPMNTTPVCRPHRKGRFRVNTYYHSCPEWLHRYLEIRNAFRNSSFISMVNERYPGLLFHSVNKWFVTPPTHQRLLA